MLDLPHSVRGTTGVAKTLVKVKRMTAKNAFMLGELDGSRWAAQPRLHLLYIRLGLIRPFSTYLRM